MISTETQLAHLERRTQSRIRIEIPIVVHLPGREAPLTATSHDLSWGGVLFVLPELLPRSTRMIRVELPWRRGESICADATVLRSTPMSDGGSVIAARFSSLSFANQARLERLLKTLKATAAPRDCSGPAALVRELEIDIHESSEMQRMLGQIASGRHQLTVFDDYAVGQSICLSLGGIGAQPVLRLRARVIASRKATMQGFGWAQPYELELEFEHPEAAIDLVVKRLRGPSIVAPEPASDLTCAVDAVKVVRPEELCALEARFPELVSMLLAAWPEPSTFPRLVSDLLPSEPERSGAWPPDVWEELRFLRSLHSLVFGSEP